MDRGTAGDKSHWFQSYQAEAGIDRQSQSRRIGNRHPRGRRQVARSLHANPEYSTGHIYKAMLPECNIPRLGRRMTLMGLAKPKCPRPIVRPQYQIRSRLGNHHRAGPYALHKVAGNRWGDSYAVGGSQNGGAGEIGKDAVGQALRPDGDAKWRVDEPQRRGWDPGEMIQGNRHYRIGAEDRAKRIGHQHDVITSLRGRTAHWSGAAKCWWLPQCLSR